MADPPFPFSAAENRGGRFRSGVTDWARQSYGQGCSDRRSAAARRLIEHAKRFGAEQHAAVAVAAAEAVRDPLPLHTAALKGDLAALRSLLGQSTCTRAVLSTTKAGQTALHYSSRRGHAAASSLLLRAGADPNAREDAGWTPLMLAAKRGHAETAAQLLDAKPALELVNKQGLSALAMACTAGHEDVVAALLHAGCSGLGCDKAGWTVLHICAKKNWAGALRLLLGGSTRAAVNAVNADGDTALHLCCRRGHGALVPLLLGAGAKPGPINNVLRQQPLHSVCHTGDVAAAMALLGAGADPNAVDAASEAPLHFAARQGHLGVIRALLHAGAAPGGRCDAAGGDIKAGDGDGELRRQHQQVVTVHWTAGGGLAHFSSAPAGGGGTADSGSGHPEGTPLHLAAKEGRSEAMLLLLSAGALPDALDRQGRNSLALAEQVQEGATAGRTLRDWSARVALIRAQQRLSWSRVAAGTAAIALAERRQLLHSGCCTGWCRDLAPLVAIAMPSVLHTQTRTLPPLPTRSQAAALSPAAAGDTERLSYQVNTMGLVTARERQATSNDTASASAEYWRRRQQQQRAVVEEEPARAAKRFCICIAPSLVVAGAGDGSSMPGTSDVNPGDDHDS